MSKKKFKITKNQMKYIILGASLAVVLAVGICLAIFLPSVKAESELSKMFCTLEAMENPAIIITDMKADNIMSGARGEIKLEGAASTEVLMDDILALSGKLEYKGKTTSGAWDLRVKIYEGDSAVELYLAYKEMYYVKDNVKYIFTPDSEETLKAYQVIYSTFSALVK